MTQVLHAPSGKLCIRTVSTGATVICHLSFCSQEPILASIDQLFSMEQIPATVPSMQCQRKLCNRTCMHRRDEIIICPHPFHKASRGFIGSPLLFSSPRVWTTATICPVKVNLQSKSLSSSRDPESAIADCIVQCSMSGPTYEPPLFGTMPNLLTNISACMFRPSVLSRISCLTSLAFPVLIQ